MAAFSAPSYGRDDDQAREQRGEKDKISKPFPFERWTSVTEQRGEKPRKKFSRLFKGLEDRKNDIYKSFYVRIARLPLSNEG